MQQILSFQLIGDRVVRQRTRIESDKQIMKKEQNQIQKSQLVQHNPLQQTPRQFKYTNKTITHQFLPLIAKHTQTLSKEPYLIRNDIYLIKVKVNKIKVQNHSEVKNHALNKLINGKVRFRIMQKNPFYLSPSQFKQKFEKQLKVFQPSFIDARQTPNPDQIFRPINHQIQKLTNLVVQNLDQENTQNRKKSKRINPMTKISKQNLFRLILSSFQSTDLKNKDRKPFNVYQQNYQLPYKRQFETQKNEAHTQEEDQDQYQLQNKKKQGEKKLILQSRPNLNNLFQKDDSLMFAGTEESVFDIKFEQPELFETVQHLKDFKQQKPEKLPRFNVFWANFRIKNFCHIPFTQHLLTINLDHKLQNIQNQQKRLPKKQRIRFVIDLSMYLVPGNKNGWGILKIDECSVNWKDFITENKQKRLLKLKIEFPDVIERNKRLTNSERSEVETKIQTLDHGESPVWTEDLFIKINPQRNKLRIMLIEMEDNRFDLKSIIAERTIFLLEEGYLFDNVQSTRHILLKSYVGSGEQEQKTADLIMSFSFEMAINDQIAQVKSASDKNNAFVNRLSTLK